VRGVVPLFLVKNFVVGSALISSPFAVYGGILADSESVRKELLAKVQSLGDSLRVQYVDLRNAYREQCAGLPGTSRYVTFTQQTRPDEESTLQALPKKTRNLVRKALRFPFSTRFSTRGFDGFERLYSSNMRRLGTPSFPRKHFAALLENFGDMIDIREVFLGDRLVAACLNFRFRDQLHVYYAASDYEAKECSPNNYMYFDLLCWAGKNGYSTFDFGRCKRGTGVFAFKQHWDTTMRELPYEVLLVNQKEIPNYSPTNPKFQLAIKLWKHLPLPVTRTLGPRLVRLFP
jgi:FemAB-related protein (PEP-CTERM system-associated)